MHVIIIFVTLACSDLHWHCTVPHGHAHTHTTAHYTNQNREHRERERQVARLKSDEQK